MRFIMSFLNKLLFWRRDDELEFEQIAEKELQSHERPLYPDHNTAKPGEMEEPSLFDEPRADERPLLPSTRPAATAQNPRDVELINSKLDTIKAMLNSLDQRMAHLERSNSTEKKERLW